MEEMGIGAELTPAFSFVYRVELGNGLVEHELDHVFVGRFAGTPDPDPLEVQSWDWVELPKLKADCAADPGSYTAWLPIALLQLKGL
jgi:isopentenyl-diphosphate Delta-isomerase